MADVVDSRTRSRMMSGIRSKNTKPELIIRQALHHLGFRYRLHSPDLPGKPDLVLKKYNAIIFVHGCFWHKHNCHLFKWPKTRPDFWKKKIERNQKKDAESIEALRERNWRICIVWECSVKGAKADVRGVVNRLVEWIESKEIMGEITA